MSFNIEQRIKEISQRIEENNRKIDAILNPGLFSRRSSPHPSSKEYEPVYRLERENAELFDERIELENELRRQEGLPYRLPYQPDGESEIDYMDRIVREREEDEGIRVKNKLQRAIDKKNAKLIEEFGDSPEVQVYALQEQLALYDRSSPEYREIRSAIRDLKHGIRQAEAEDGSTESDESRLRRQGGEESIPRSSGVRKSKLPIQTRSMPRASSPIRATSRTVKRASSPMRRNPSSKITSSRVETVERRSSRRRTRRTMPPRDPVTGRFLPRCR